MAYLATDETIDRSRRCPHYNMCLKPLQHSDIMRSLSKQYTEYSLLLWLSDANVIGVTWSDGARRWRHARLGHRIECHAFRPFKLRRFTLEIIPDFTLVPEAFLYSLLANFATRTASFNCFYWHEALRAEKRKPLVKTVGNLTFMPSAFDRRFWLEDIFYCSASHMIGWIKYLWGWEWSVNIYLYG